METNPLIVSEGMSEQSEPTLCLTVFPFFPETQFLFLTVFLVLFYASLLPLQG